MPGHFQSVRGIPATVRYGPLRSDIASRKRGLFPIFAAPTAFAAGRGRVSKMGLLQPKQQS